MLLRRPTILVQIGRVVAGLRAVRDVHAAPSLCGDKHGVVGGEDLKSVIPPVAGDTGLLGACSGAVAWVRGVPSHRVGYNHSLVVHIHIAIHT